MIDLRSLARLRLIFDTNVRAAAADTRRIMLERGLADAEGMGDAATAAKYRKAIAELPTPGLQVRDDGDKIVLEKPYKSVTLPPISDEINPQPASGNIPAPPIGNFGGQNDPAPDVAGRIDRAIKRNPQQGRETALEKIRREREALEQLAALEPDIGIPFHAVSDIRETNEHNIRIAPDGRFWKYTKGDRYGYLPTEIYPDLHDMSKVAIGIDPASPSQYLERIRLHNSLFGDDVKIEGISSTGGLVISQRPIKGREATEEEITSALAAAGWVKVPSGRQALPDILKDTAWYYRETKTIMVDARPANVIVDGEGRLHMIDVMLKKAEDALLALLETL